MTAETTMSPRDQKHAEIVASLLSLSQRSAGWKAHEIRDLALRSVDWLNLLICDLRGHEAATTTREDAPDAGGGATLRKALFPFADAYGDDLNCFEDEIGIGSRGLTVGDLRRARDALAATARPAGAEASCKENGGSAAATNASCKAAEPVTGGKLLDDMRDVQGVIETMGCYFPIGSMGAADRDLALALLVKHFPVLAPTRDASDGEGE